jgi:hypothetical protein
MLSFAAVGVNKGCVWRRPSRSLVAIVAALLIPVVLLGCKDKDGSLGGGSGQQQVPNTVVAKISMHADGTFLVDGSAMNLATLDQQLSKLATDSGVVWYYREHPESNPHPNALKVMDLVIKHNLSISMSSKPDFSDYIDDQGRSRPRK